MKTVSVKTEIDTGSFSIISLTECQEALSEGQFVKQMRDTLSGADIHAQALVLIHTRIGDFTDFYMTFPQTMKLNHSVLGSDGGSLWRLLCSLT